MKRIGITGPTGAGKTTALQALVELDAHIIDADAVYHALLESSATLRAELTARFGPSILDGEGRVNRKALGGVVFGDPAALAELNAITHRFILAEIDRQAAGAEEQGRSAVAIDAIALIESGLGETCGDSGHTGPQGTAHPADHGPGGDFGGLRPEAGGGPAGGRLFPHPLRLSPGKPGGRHAGGLSGPCQATV